MKIRGSLIIDKDLTLLNPNGSSPSKGLVALSDDNGKVKWGHTVILPIDLLYVYPDKGTLVIHNSKVYYSLVNKALGNNFGNEFVWKEITKVGAEQLTEDQLKAIQNASAPSSSNPFITLEALFSSLEQIQLKGDVTGSAVIENGKLVINTVLKADTSTKVDVIKKISGTIIQSHVPVAVINNRAYKFDASIPGHQFAFTGFSTNGSVTGEECIIQERGEIFLQGWGLEPNAHYLAGVSGTLIRNNTSTTNFTKVIGYATSSNSLRIINDYTTINK